MPQKYSPEFKAPALQLIEQRIQAAQCSARAGSPEQPSEKCSAGPPPTLCGTGGGLLHG